MRLRYRSLPIAVLVCLVQARLAAAQPAPEPTPTPPPTDQPQQTPPTTPDQPPTTPPDQTPTTTTPPKQPEPPPEPPPAEEPKSQSQFHRNFAGSVQLDYMGIPTENTGRTIALDGATAEVSLKLAMDYGNKISSNVKVCVACHGVEVGMAFFDLRMADELNFRIGRFTPSFGEFPVRHDPANHRTSDKPLPYDMGRMLRNTEWNEGILPAPWVDNGIELNGTHFFGQHLQVDYAAYAIGGPRAGANPTDFDYKQSRSGESYYIDNNSRPVVGGQVSASIIAGDVTVAAGASGMGGTYDPFHRLPFRLYGAHFIMRFQSIFLRAEYLIRRTEMAMGTDPSMTFKYGPGPDGTYNPWFTKDGGYVELEAPVTSRLTAVLREDGLRRRGNVIATSTLRSDSAVLRHTVGVAIVLRQALRLKLSYEFYDFSDFKDESVVHVGVAGPF